MATVSKSLKQLEVEIRKLIPQGRTMLWEVATRCVMLLNDCDSYAQQIDQKTEEVLGRLNGYLADFNVSLDECVSILQIFPDREDWLKAKNVRDLFDRAVAKIKDDDRSERERNADTVPRRKSVKVSEYEAAVEKLASAEKREESAQTEIGRLRSENDQLRAKVATLEGQVQELRRLHAVPSVS